MNEENARKLKYIVCIVLAGLFLAGSIAGLASSYRFALEVEKFYSDTGVVVTGYYEYIWETMNIIWTVVLAASAVWLAYTLYLWSPFGKLKARQGNGGKLGQAVKNGFDKIAGSKGGGAGTMRKCPHCGAPMTEGAAYCRKCGESKQD